MLSKINLAHKWSLHFLSKKQKDPFQENFNMIKFLKGNSRNEFRVHKKSSTLRMLLSQ